MLRNEATGHLPHGFTSRVGDVPYSMAFTGRFSGKFAFQDANVACPRCNGSQAS